MSVDWWWCIDWWWKWWYSCKLSALLWSLGVLCGGWDSGRNILWGSWDVVVCLLVCTVERVRIGMITDIPMMECLWDWTLDDGPFDALDRRKMGAVAAVAMVDGVSGADGWILVAVGGVIGCSCGGWECGQWRGDKFWCLDMVWFARCCMFYRLVSCNGSRTPIGLLCLNRSVKRIRFKCGMGTGLIWFNERFRFIMWLFWIEI